MVKVLRERERESTNSCKLISFFIYIFLVEHLHRSTHNIHYYSFVHVSADFCFDGIYMLQLTLALSDDVKMSAKRLEIHAGSTAELRCHKFRCIYSGS